MSAIINHPGPLKFTIKDLDGNKYKGECYAISMSQDFSAHEKVFTTIQFSGHNIVQVEKAKKKKKYKKGKRK
jgi:hypothetical protein